MNGSSQWRVSTHCCRWWSEFVRRSGSASLTPTRRLSRATLAPECESTSRSPINAVPVSTLSSICTRRFTHPYGCMRERARANCEIEPLRRLFFSETSDSFLREHCALGRFAVCIRVDLGDEISRATRTTDRQEIRRKFSDATWSGKPRLIIPNRLQE